MPMRALRCTTVLSTHVEQYHSISTIRSIYTSSSQTKAIQEEQTTQESNLHFEYLQGIVEADGDPVLMHALPLQLIDLTLRCKG